VPVFVALELVDEALGLGRLGRVAFVCGEHLVVTLAVAAQHGRRERAIAGEVVEQALPDAADQVLGDLALFGRHVVAREGFDEGLVLAHAEGVHPHAEAVERVAEIILGDGHARQQHHALGVERDFLRRSSEVVGFLRQNVAVGVYRLTGLAQPGDRSAQLFDLGKRCSASR